MAKRLLDYDPISRTSTYHEYDHGTKKTIITESQDVSAILKQAQAYANDPSYKARGIKEDHYHFARVPNSVLVELMQKYNLDWRRKEDMPAIERVLSRDYKKLLTVDRI